MRADPLNAEECAEQSGFFADVRHRHCQVVRETAFEHELIESLIIRHRYIGGDVGQPPGSIRGTGATKHEELEATIPFWCQAEPSLRSILELTNVNGSHVAAGKPNNRMDSDGVAG